MNSGYLILWKDGWPLHYLLQETHESRYLEIPGGIQNQLLVRDKWHDSGSPYVGYSVYAKYPTLEEASQALKAIQAALQVMGS